MNPSGPVNRPRRNRVDFRLTGIFINWDGISKASVRYLPSRISSRVTPPISGRDPPDSFLRTPFRRIARNSRDRLGWVHFSGGLAGGFSFSSFCTHGRIAGSVDDMGAGDFFSGAGTLTSFETSGVALGTPGSEVAFPSGAD